MHRSRLGGLIIDCQGDDLEGAADFWSKALGLTKQPIADPADRNYVTLDTGPADPHVEVQRVDHPSRVHIDIESDDIPAEVARLEQLGARKLSAVRDWVVMEAPTGHRFCVVKAERSTFAGDANVWD